MKRKLLSLFLSLALLFSLAAPALAAETASVVRLTKTAGTVEISKSSGKSISLLENMRLYNGYHVTTSEESYAWINLDDSKLLKEDAESEVEVRKDGKNLEVQVASGNVFFDVAEDLGDDESLNIRTSTMVVGIRGTSGWIQVEDRWVTRVSVLEGTVECSVADPVTGEMKAEAVSGGETVLCVVYPQEKTGDKSAILREKYTVDDIPGFVLTDLVRNIPLCDKVEAETNLDIPRDLASVAGGDPSGREPEGDSATREVLGEADRREDEDEDDLHDRIEEIEKELEKQPGAVSPSKPIEKPAPAPSDKDSDRDSDRDSGGSDSGTTTPDPAPPKPEPEPPGPEPEPPVYTITFQANGGEWSGETERTVQTAADGTVTPPEAPTRSGYTFSGWYDAPAGGTALPAGRVFTADTALYAHWTADAPPTPPYTITFNVNGGTMADPATMETDLAGMLSSLPAPTREKNTDATAVYSFDGWFDAETGGNQVTTSTTFTADTTLYARWTITSGWDWELASGKLRVFGTGPMNDYYNGDSVIDGYYPPWTSDASNIQEVVIEEGITKIGNHAFFIYNPYLGGTATFPNIKKVTIANSVTSIGRSAFESCSGLTSVVIPDSVTSIGYEAFSGCSGLTSVNIPDSVTSIGTRTFAYCSGLTSVAIPDSVTSIEADAFEGCSGLTSITVDEGNTAYSSDDIALFNKGKTTLIRFPRGRSGAYSIPDSVTSIEAYAFSSCSSLTSVNIPDSVTSIGSSAFSGCSGLTSVTILASITSIGFCAFEGCSSLTSVNIPDSVTSIEYSAFRNCSSLTSVTIPDSVSSIQESAFNGCSSLTSVNIPASVTSIEADAFASCSGLTSITVDEGNTTYSSDDIALFNKDKTTLIQFPGGRSGAYSIPASVTSIGNRAFSGCSRLTSVSIPNGITSIGYCTFLGCSGLTSVNIPDSVTSIGYSAFRNCSSLTSVNIPASVTSIWSDAFSGCSGLTSINFSGTKAQWNSISASACIRSGVTVHCTDGDITTP